MYIIKLKQTIEFPKQKTQKQIPCSVFSPLNKSRQAEEEYSHSFRLLMNKVLKRIYDKTNFIEIKNQRGFQSLENRANSQDRIVQKKEANSLEKRMSRTFNQHNKLKINGMQSTQNMSNLLRSSIKSNIYNKTSVSFINNKQHRRSINFQRTKSLTSQEIDSQISSNKSGFQNTFYNTRYSKRELRKLPIQKALNVVSVIPKIIQRDDFDKMHELFKCLEEPKPIKVQLKHKIINRKIAQRQNYNKKLFFRHEENIPTQDECMPEFEPWITKQHQSNQDYFNHFKPTF